MVFFFEVSFNSCDVVNFNKAFEANTGGKITTVNVIGACNTTYQGADCSQITSFGYRPTYKEFNNNTSQSLFYTHLGGDSSYVDSYYLKAGYSTSTSTQGSTTITANLLEGKSWVNYYINYDTGEASNSGVGPNTGAIIDFIPITAGTTYTLNYDSILFDETDSVTIRVSIQDPNNEGN